MAQAPAVVPAGQEGIGPAASADPATADLGLGENAIAADYFTKTAVISAKPSFDLSEFNIAPNSLLSSAISKRVNVLVKAHASGLTGGYKAFLDSVFPTEAAGGQGPNAAPSLVNAPLVTSTVDGPDGLTTPATPGGNGTIHAGGSPRENAVKPATAAEATKAATTSPGLPSIQPPASKQLTGFIYNDAQYLASILSVESTPDLPALQSVLVKYQISASDIDGNPFLAALLGAYPGLIDRVKNPTLKTQSEGENAGNSRIVTPGANDVTTSAFSLSTSVADALGTLIEQRIKEDAEIIFLQEFRNELTRKDLKIHIQPLLPSAYAYLSLPQTANDEDAQVMQGSFLPTLQDDFKTDIKNLPTNVGPFVDSFYPNGSSQLNLTQFMVRIAGQTATSIIQKHSPYTAINDVEVESEKYDLGEKSALSVSAGIKVITLVSDMLTTDGNDHWITEAQARKLMSGNSAADNLKMAEAFFALSYAKDKQIYTSLDVNLSGIAKIDNTAPKTIEGLLMADTAKFEAFAEYAYGLAKTCEALKTDTESLKQTFNNPLSPAALSDLIPLTNDFKSLIDQIPKLSSIESGFAVDTASLDRVLGNIVTVEKMVWDARSSNYRSAILDLATILPQVADSLDQQKITTLLNSDAVGFISDLSEAKSTADVTTSLESHALPPGSYMAKQIEPFSITLNAYGGLEAGNELLIGGLAGTGARRSSLRAGVAAPVGISFNWGDFQNKYVGSTSFFVSVLDVGAIASYRFSNGGGQLPATSWSDIIAPGAFVVFEAKRLPLCLMVGTEYGPALRNVSTSTGLTLSKPAWQAPMVAIAFDVPIFDLYGHTPVASKKP